jgi:DNA polymerase-1
MSKFVNTAARYIVPATPGSGGLRLAFDVEADGLVESATKLHCVVVANLDDDQVYEYGTGDIVAALEHMARADYLTGHNIQNYDLPLLERLHGWKPKPGCAIVDTLVAGRMILPNVDDLDDQATAMGSPTLGKLRGRYSLEAWGARLGVPKVGANITDFSMWTPEMQERCVGDTA